MHEVIPAILEEKWKNIEEKVSVVKDFAGTIQIDIMDGKFVPGQTFSDPEPFSKYSKDFILEAHLMVNDPLSYLKPFADAGFKRFIAHVEALPQKKEQEEFIRQGKVFGKVGLAIDLETNIDSIKVPLDDLDILLVMLVKAGSSGQRFSQSALEKIRQLRKRTQAEIEVDGGINLESMIEAKKAGATIFSVNSFLYKNEDPKNQFNLLKKALD